MQTRRETNLEKCKDHKEKVSVLPNEIGRCLECPCMAATVMRGGCGSSTNCGFIIHVKTQISGRCAYDSATCGMYTHRQLCIPVPVEQSMGLEGQRFTGEGRSKVRDEIAVVVRSLEALTGRVMLQ